MQFKDHEILRGAHILDGLDEKSRWLLLDLSEDFRDAIASKYTGNITIHFSDGVPLKKAELNTRLVSTLKQRALARMNKRIESPALRG